MSERRHTVAGLPIRVGVVIGGCEHMLTHEEWQSVKIRTDNVWSKLAGGGVDFDYGDESDTSMLGEEDDG